MCIVTISGNIGSGKTTCLSNLQLIFNENNNTSMFYEPIDKWGEWLDKFYKNPQKYAFGFQMQIFLSFLYIDQEQINKNKLIITERCPHDSLYIFSKNALNSGLIDRSEFDIIKEFSDKLSWLSNVYIYIRTSPEVSYERIKKRSRGSEKDISIDYLYNLHNLYEEYTKQIHLYNPDVKLFIVDGNQDDVFVKEQVKDIIKSQE